MFAVVLQGRAWGGGWRIPGLFEQSSDSKRRPAHLASPPLHPVRRKDHKRTSQENTLGKAPSVLGIIKFPPRSPDNRKGGKRNLGQAAKRFGEETRRAGRPPTRYPRPPDRTGTRPGQPRPLTAAPNPSARSPPSTRALPILPRGPRSLWPATHHRAHFGGTVPPPPPPSRRLTHFPRPLPKAKPRVTPQPGSRAGEGGGAVTGEAGREGWEGPGAGLPFRLITPALKASPAPGH